MGDRNSTRSSHFANLVPDVPDVEIIEIIDFGDGRIRQAPLALQFTSANWLAQRKAGPANVEKSK